MSKTSQTKKESEQEVLPQETLVESYANTIANQIRKNFAKLDDNRAKCDALKDYLDEYTTALRQGKWDTFLLDKDIREYAKNVKKKEDDTQVSYCGAYSEVEPLAVGILGEWGSGKTHLLELIRHDLRYPHITQKDNAQKDASKKPLIIPILFNAWRFEKEEHIILPLFETLLSTLENYDRTYGDKLGKTFRVLKLQVMHGLTSLHYGLKPDKAWDATKALFSGNLKKALKDATTIIDPNEVKKQAKKKDNEKIVGDQNITEMLSPSRLSSIYYHFIQWIGNITAVENVHFVFLVDDLDRCLPENTLKMLESIKLFLDVPSCAFVLAVDDDVVERGVMHHYRDYLPRSRKEGYDTSTNAGLPITGHEYLEKIIQLPIRLPVIDIANVISFLREQSVGGWIEIVEKHVATKTLESEASSPIASSTSLKPSTPNEKNTMDEEPNNPKQDEVGRLLHYLAQHTPPKYRKIKRVAKLFETKLELLRSRGLLGRVDLILVAKLTLLELFAPKLLRFIQSQGYGKVFNRLCLLKEVAYLNAVADEKSEEKKSEIKKQANLLSDYTLIEAYIEKNFNSDTGLMLTRAMEIIKEHHLSRVYFDLDAMFEESYESDTQLKPILELQETTSSKNLQQSSIAVADDFYIKLFRGGDTEGWREALAEHNALINEVLLTKIIEEATIEIDNSFNSLPFIANPEWVGIVAEYVSDTDYITLLSASHDSRFQTHEILDFAIDSFAVTFAEYDRYCEIIGDEVEKPADKGWGRGRRPVIYVSCYEATAYITWLNDQMDRGYALPTAQQWQDACNLGKDTKWHFGDEESALAEYAWYDANSGDKTHPVGELKPNAIGCYDMHGNVWEWCDKKEKEYKVIRGGSWSDSPQYAQTAYTNGLVPDYSNFDVGFRLLRTYPWDS